MPASRFAIDLAVDELDAADVEAAGRLVEDEQLAGRARTRGRRPTFCWLPPDSVPARTVDRRRPDVELLDGRLGVPADRGVVAQEPPRERRPVVAREARGCPQSGNDEDEAEAVPVGRDVGDAGLVHLRAATGR